LSIITKHKNNKPLLPRKLDNSVLDKLVKFIDTDTKNVNFIKTKVENRSEDPEPPSIYSDNDDDFKGSYLGEVELKLEQTSLNDCETIHFENEEDLLKQVVLFIQKSTENYLAVAKDDPLDIVVVKASDSLYDKYCRGEVTSLICNSTFKINHSRIGWQNVDTIEAEFLPDNLAIGIYQNEKIDYDITVLGYINRKKKWIKLKLVTDYAIVCFEED
jgi:hypothetical protein